MKKFTIIFLSFVFCGVTQAQITINPWDYTLDPTGDTLLLDHVDVTGEPTIITGADVTWNYSHLQMNGTEEIVSYEGIVNDPLFPTSNLREANTYLMFGGLTIPTYNYYTLNSSGFTYDGRINQAVKLPLGSLTGNPADSLFTLFGARQESTPKASINFPLSYGDSSYTTSTSDINMLVTVTNAGLVNFPVTQRTYSTNYKKTEGWGKLILTNPTTQELDTFEVLLQVVTTTRIDSFLDANGQPIALALLQPLGLSQGINIVNRTTYYWYAKGVNRYAFGARQDALGLTIGAVNREIFAQGFNVKTKEAKSITIEHSVYPNPIKNSQFQIELEKDNAENWQIEIYNVIGQMVHQEAVTDNVSTIRLNKGLSSGQYFYAVKNEQGQMVANGKLKL